MKSFREYLIELFDKPLSVTHDEKLTKYLRDTKEHHFLPEDEVHAINAHKLDGNHGHLISFHRNGYFEVHHQDENGNSGKMTGKKHKVSLHWVGAAIKMYKTKLDKGAGVKIYGPDELHTHYTKIVDKLKRHYPKHIITHGIEKHYDGESKSIMINPKPAFRVKGYEN